MISKKLRVFGYISITIGLLMSCNNDNKDFVIKKEMELLDSLTIQMEVVEQKLDIDFKEIDERVEEMQIDIMKMRMTEKTFEDRMGQMMDRYVSIQKAYKSFYEPYKNAKSEADEISVQLITLRQSVEKQEYSKDKFKEFYELEKTAINKLEDYIAQNIQPVLDMEMEYRRIQAKIDQHLYGDELKGKSGE